LEDRLHALVVNGKLDLKTAQREIATDWIAAYKKYVGPYPPPAIVFVSPQQSQTNPRHANLVAKPRRQPNPPQLKFG
jgi:hypothetical protein